MRRVALLLPASPTDAQFQARVGAFLQGLQQAGWAIGRNVQLEYRWAENNPNDTRKHAAELVALAPDVILADGAGSVGAVLQVTRTIPIVFPVAGDPVGAGFVETLARPGGNATGFMNFEYSISAKWLDLLKQIAPDVTRVAVLRDPALPTGIGQFGVIQAAAASFRVDVVPVNVFAVSDIERGVASLAQRPNGGLIMTANPTAIAHRSHIIELAQRHKLPAVYFEPVFARDGGLISYGPDIVDQYRRAATTGGVGQFAAIQSMAPSLGVEAIAVNVRDPNEIERTITDFGRSANGGLIVTGSGLAMIHRELIATLAARHKLPAVYWDRAPVSAGGLISYGADLRDQYRQAAGYVDRILKGEKPADLPVQAPTKYELVINLKTAKALGLDVPPSLLARADEVIE